MYNVLPLNIVDTIYVVIPPPKKNYNIKTSKNVYMVFTSRKLSSKSVKWQDIKIDLVMNDVLTELQHMVNVNCIINSNKRKHLYLHIKIQQAELLHLKYEGIWLIKCCITSDNRSHI